MANHPHGEGHFHKRLSRLPAIADLQKLKGLVPNPTFAPSETVN